MNTSFFGWLFGGMRKHKLLLSILLLVVILLCIGGGVLHYYKNSHMVTVTYDKTVASVELWKTETSGDSGKQHVVKKIVSSPAEVRIGDNISYELRYKGAAGYADGVIAIGSDTTIALSPDYSTSRYAAMFAEEKVTINQTIQSIDPTIASLYVINDGTYYGRGMWYITTLTSTQEPERYFDTFVVVLQRSNQAWTVAVSPTIVANYKEHSSIPKDVIDFANTYRQKEALREITERTVY
jgi:hypothetical protein